MNLCAAAATEVRVTRFLKSNTTTMAVKATCWIWFPKLISSNLNSWGVLENMLLFCLSNRGPRLSPEKQMNPTGRNELPNTHTKIQVKHESAWFVSMKTTADQRVTGLFKLFILGSRFSIDLWNPKNEWRLPADGVCKEEQGSHQENQKLKDVKLCKKTFNRVISMISNWIDGKRFLFTYFESQSCSVHFLLPSANDNKHKR